MLTGIKIYFQLLVNQSVSKTSETTNRMIFTETKILVHFYKKKFRDIIIIFHDLPWPWLFSMTFQAWKMVLLKFMTFHDFRGRVVTLISGRHSCHPTNRIKATKGSQSNDIHWRKALNRPRPFFIVPRQGMPHPYSSSLMQVHYNLVITCVVITWIWL